MQDVKQSKRLHAQHRLAHVSHHIQAAKGQHQPLGASLPEGLLHALGYGGAGCDRLAKGGQNLFERICLHGPGIVRGHRDKPGHQRGHGFIHVGIILIRHHTGEGGDLPSIQIIPDVLSQGLQALGIVPTIYNHIGVLPQ